MPTNPLLVLGYDTIVAQLVAGTLQLRDLDDALLALDRSLPNDVLPELERVSNSALVDAFGVKAGFWSRQLLRSIVTAFLTNRLVDDVGSVDGTFKLDELLRLNGHPGVSPVSLLVPYDAQNIALDLIGTGVRPIWTQSLSSQ